MEKFLLVLFFIIKILFIVVAPIALYVFRDKYISKYIGLIEIFGLIVIVILYIIGFSYMVDSNITNMLNLKMLNKSDDSILTDYKTDLSVSNSIKKLAADKSYKTHKNEIVFYYNGYELPMGAKKIKCGDNYEYYRHYSDILSTTSMLLSTYFQKEIDPVEILDKAISNNVIKCGEPINSDSFFNMIYKEYKVNFVVIKSSELENYILNGKPVILQTKGNGNLSCTPSYFLIYDINNLGEYLMLDPNNKSFSYMCPDGTDGFGNVLKPNYNDQTFNYSNIISDYDRFIVIGGTR